MADQDASRGDIWCEGTGESKDDPLVIHGATDDLVGIAAQFQWLEQMFGRKDVDWKLIFQAHGYHGDRSIDTVHVELRDGSERTVYFDNTESFGKWGLGRLPTDE
jgi:hypothetical protein